MSIALDLVAKGANHLRMADVAAFANVDVAPLQFERCIGAHAVNFLDRVLEIEERSDLDEAADRNHHQDADGQEQGMALECFVPFHESHDGVPYSAG